MGLIEKEVFNDIWNGVVFYNENIPLVGVSKYHSKYQLRSSVNGCRTTIGKFDILKEANKFLLDRVGTIGDIEINTPIIDGETWKQIPLADNGYMASSHGRILSLFKNRLRLLKQNIGVGGYYTTSVSISGKRVTKTVHLLVANTFLEHTPNKTHELVVDHLNGDKSNNSILNLEVVSHRENVKRSRGGEFKRYSGNKKSSTYFSRIYVDGVRHYLGNYASPEEAIAAYDNAHEELVINKQKER